MATQEERFTAIENELGIITNEIGLKLDEQSRNILEIKQQLTTQAHKTHERLSNIETVLIQILARLPEKPQQSCMS
jgi:GTP-dependent phosphoenolpyruvate carboxykinase